MPSVFHFAKCFVFKWQSEFLDCKQIAAPYLQSINLYRKRCLSLCFPNCFETLILFYRWLTPMIARVIHSAITYDFRSLFWIELGGWWFSFRLSSSFVLANPMHDSRSSELLAVIAGNSINQGRNIHLATLVRQLIIQCWLHCIRHAAQVDNNSIRNRK